MEPPPAYSEAIRTTPVVIPTNSAPVIKTKNVLRTTKKAIASLFITTILLIAYLGYWNVHGFNTRLAVYFSIVPLITLVSGYYGIEKKNTLFIMPLIVCTILILIGGVILSIGVTAYLTITTSNEIRGFGFYFAVFVVFFFVVLCCIIKFLEYVMASRRVIINEKKNKGTYRAVSSS